MPLQLECVTKTYHSNGRAVSALKDVSLHVESGQFCALSGKSGCGKSTLLLAAGGLLRPDQGQVIIEGQDVYALTPDQRARFRAMHVGFVFQQFHLVPYLNILDNVLAAALGVPDASTVEYRRRARDLIDRFGLTDRVMHRPAQLSTGERQRTALARALLNSPRVLLADEPTGNLDEENSDIVLRHLQEFAAQGGAVLLVTHDLRAAQLAHHSWRMADGELM